MPANPFSCSSASFKKTKQESDRVEWSTWECLVTYRRVLASAEFEAADNGAQGQLQFLHGEAHADAVARTQAERRVRVRIQFVFVLRRPSAAQQRAIAVGKAVHAVQIPSKNLHSPGGIERFRPIVVLFGEMKRINGNTHNHSLLDVDSIEGQVLIALALQSIEREKKSLNTSPSSNDDCRFTHLGTGEYIRKTSWMNWSM